MLLLLDFLIGCVAGLLWRLADRAFAWRALPQIVMIGSVQALVVFAGLILVRALGGLSGSHTQSNYKVAALALMGGFGAVILLDRLRGRG